ncbi:MFS transporter [Ferruginibacter paludis]|uniref:MFS transporter n=1 Tax=Ferruginibacter paludis TaxID=1310417 RepID=UPI0025B4B7C4|nr:MFS transporter [Ferruginibacter paludis]MDN3656137.1 MFS transporter [Ferruginibacter paludis]
MSTATTANVTSPTANSFWSPFKSKIFLVIWLAAFFSDLGMWMQGVGASWIITRQTASPLYISLMVTATSLPMFLLGIPAGALADIFNKRKILLLTQSWMFIMALILAVFGFLNYTPPLLMLVLSFLLALGPAINETVWQAIVPGLVPPARLSSAITLNGVSINLSRAIGPALGGLIISFYAPEYIFIVNAVCFLGTLLAVYFWSGMPANETLQTERFVSAMRIGLNYVRYATQLHPVLIRSVTFAIGASALWGLLPLIIIQKLHQTAGIYGAMLFSLGGGAIISAIILPSINSVLNIDQKLLIAVLLVGANLLILHFFSNNYLLFAGLFFAGIGWLMAMSSFNVAIQTNVPAWVLSRAISVYLLLFQGGMALGGIIWGTIASRMGIQYAIFLAFGWMAASLLLAIPYALKNISIGSFTPAAKINTLVPALEITESDGPVLVWIDYEVSQENIQQFTTAALLLKNLRMRNGAMQVGVFQNITSPTIITEFFIVESWSQYLLQIQRYTTDDIAIEEAVLKYHSGNTQPAKRVMISQI